jgi:serine/threonine-protein kinase
MAGEENLERDELKLAWRMLEARLEREHAPNLGRFRHERLPRVRNALWPIAAAQAIQLLLGALMFVWFALFWTEHRALPHLLALGAIGQLWSAALVGLAVAQLVGVARVDYSAPVLAIQKHIAALRAQRVRTAPFLMVSGCLMWLPVTLVVFDPRRGRLARRVDDELAGRSLVRAEAILAEVAAFERE